MPLRHTCAHVAKPPHCDLNASALRLASLIAAQIERGEGLSSFLQSLRKSLESWGLWRPRQGEAPAHAGEAKSGAPLDDGAAPGTANSARRLPYKIGLIIMILSLGSGLATYAILTGLTPIVPTHLVVVGMLLLNLVLVLAMVMIIAWQVTGTLACPPPPGRRRAAPCPHRQPVQRHRRGAGNPARDLRQRVARPRPRPLVLHPHQIHHSKLGGRGDRLCPGARPGDPRRHARHGQGHRRGGQPREVAAASLRQFPVGASLDQGAAHRLSDRR